MSNAEASAPTYVSGKFIKPDTIEEREYQRQMVEAGLSQSSLIALPTGTGKTPVGVRIAAQRLEKPGGKVLMMAPTQPLVQQHYEAFTEFLTIPEHEIKVFTGDTSPDERKKLWNGATSVVIATPQVIENDLVGNRYTLEDVVHLIFDECHRATGDYSYNYIAERYHGNAKHPLVTGLSASPGSDREKILTVCKNIGVTNVEVLTEDDEVLNKYLSDTEIEYQRLDMPEDILKARDLMQNAYTDRLTTLKDGGVMNSRAKNVSFQQLQSARGKIQGLINNNDSAGYKLASVHAQAMKLYHLLKIVESQGVEATLEYLQGIEDDANSSDGTKAAENLMQDTDLNKARRLLEDFEGIHPKLTRLGLEVSKVLAEDGQVLVFTEYRSTVDEVVEFLEQNDSVRPARFVGQKDKDNNDGMSQKEQKQTIEEFRNGDYNVLVATSVAEEGLDIPAVDLVMMYEPIPSGIRTIQRRGRTGRQRDGSVIVLIANDTRDESKYWISKNREDKMREDMNELKQMEGDLNDELQEEQASLSEFGERVEDNGRPTILIDSREVQSGMTKTLDRHPDVTAQLENNMAVGDYVVSDRVGIERKSHDDFLDTLLDDRGLFDQIGDLAGSYSRPVLMLEGENGIEGLFNKRQIDRKAIEGALAAIAVDYNVSIIHTEDADGTASMLATLAKREQIDSDREVSAHGKKSVDSLTDEQEYVVSSVADVGPVLAKNLLAHFGSVHAVLDASVDELMEVDKVGEATAEHIYRVCREDYSPGE